MEDFRSLDDGIFSSNRSWKTKKLFTEFPGKYINRRLFWEKLEIPPTSFPMQTLISLHHCGCIGEA